MKNRKLIKLIRESEAGQFRASYQVAMIYQKGSSGIEQNKKEADKFKRICADQLADYKFSLSSVKLLNFKSFENITVNFSQKSNVTVLVGNNGSGKSTIIDAIKKALSHFSSRLSTRSFNGDAIEVIDINNNNNAESATIIPRLKLNDYSFQCDLSNNKPLKPIKSSSFDEFNEVSRIFKEVNSVGDPFNFPLIACYNVERANETTTKDIEKSDAIKDSHVWDQSQGYSKSLNGKADFKLFFRWFKESASAEGLDSTKVNAIKIAIETEQNRFNSASMQQLLASAAEEHVSHFTVEYEDKIADLNKQLTELRQTPNLSNKSLDIVKEAIYQFLPDFSELDLSLNPLDLIMKKNGIPLSVLQLSQGEKSLLALVADMARRMTLLNPKRENPLEGNGIVLIDEIDLHLHPSWQQLIIPRLTNVFPNIQFILTTHSPQVLTTVQSSDIRILNDGKINETRALSFGEESRSTLEDIMGTSSRPIDENSKKLKAYLSLINQGDIDSAESIKMRLELDLHYGSQNSQLRLADMMINRFLAIRSKK